MPRDPVACALGIEPEPALSRRKLAVAVLPVPDPTTSLTEAERFDHQDLAALDGRGLWRELKLAELAVTLDDLPEPWRLARLDAVRTEVARRRGAR